MVASFLLIAIHISYCLGTLLPLLLLILLLLLLLVLKVLLFLALTSAACSVPLLEKSGAHIESRVTESSITKGGK
jgi:hypothetical protein